MFDHFLESSHREDSNKWSNIGFGQEIKDLVSIEIHFTHLIWRSVYVFTDIINYRMHAVLPCRRL